MSIRNRAEAFARVFSGVPYKYENGPTAESANNWFVEGLNCQLFIHLACRDFFEVTLPQDLRSSEMFADSEWFLDKSVSDLEEGDIMFFGPKNLLPRRDPNDEDAKKLHVAMVISVSQENGVEVIHARYKQGIVIEPLETVQKIRWITQRPYEKVFAVKALKV